MTFADWERARVTAGVVPGTESESVVPARRTPTDLLITEAESPNNNNKKLYCEKSNKCMD